MTLVITELSMAGIVMVADSAISEVDTKTGRVIKVNTNGWAKIVRIPKINAAISYWGAIGAITHKQFDVWLKDIVSQSTQYSDLYSFAEYLKKRLNESCHGKPLNKYQNSGIHLAGFADWIDGIKRPVFLHIHNGHLSINTIHQYDEHENLIAIYPRLASEDIKLFEIHKDFPNISIPIEENLLMLRQTYITHNGDYFPYIHLFGALQSAVNYLNLLPGLSIPANPANLGSRKDFLHMVMETVIRVYLTSNHKQKPIVGGKATSLGITLDNYLLPIGQGIG